MKAISLLLCVASCVTLDAQGRSGVTYVPAVPLDKRSEVVTTNEYSVVLDYRPSPGRAEIHQRYTQIFHILDGAGILVVRGNSGGSADDRSRRDSWNGHRVAHGLSVVEG